MKKISIAYLIFLFCGIVWVAFFPEKGSVADVNAALELPSLSAWFGKDSLGRDLFVRLLQGAEVSLGVGLTSSFLALLMGACYGAFSAMSPKWVDQVFMRVAEVLMSLPSVVLMAVLAVVLQTIFFGSSLVIIFWVLAFGSWMPSAKLTRNLIHQEKSQNYIQAARAIGASKWRIFWFHLIPNLVSPILIFWSLQIPHAVLAEGLLSFLGFGVRSPGVSWGALLQEGWKSLASSPHLLIGPSLFLFLTILSLNILLENFRQSLDPKLKSFE